MEAPKKGGVVHYPLAGDRRSLQWLANQNAVTLHVWPSRTPRLDRPDLCVLDLDPSRDEPGELREAMLALRLAARRSWDTPAGSRPPGRRAFTSRCQCPRARPSTTPSALAERLAGLLVDRHPRTLTREFAKADRDGRIYLDTGRNRAGATFAAAYTVRARPGAPVSAPCTWDEIEAGAVHPQIVHTANDAGAPGRGRRPVGRSEAAVVDSPIYFFGGSTEMSRASVQVISSWSPTLSVSKVFLSLTRRL